MEISKKSTIFAQNFCHFRQHKQPNMLTKHFDITENQVIFEILMPATDERYIYYEFINHKITEKHIWKLK